jgi:hypothetical protein
MAPFLFAYFFMLPAANNLCRTSDADTQPG